MTASPPVHQQRDWRHLQRATVGAHRALGAMVQKNFRAQFACAASIAVWLLQHRPDLAARPRLHLVVAQATEFEALDGGRWLQFVPWLLGRPNLVLRVTLVGRLLPDAEIDHDAGAGAGAGVGVGADADADADADAVPAMLDATELQQRLKTHAWTLVKDRPPAVLVQGTVGAWRREGLSSGADDLPDLCAVFSPEFAQHHASLLGDDGLLPLLREGVPLALFSSSEAEQLVDLFTLRSFGLAPLDPECWPNPWALEPAGCATDAAYARMGWAAEFAEVPVKAQPDQGRLLALDAALSYVRNLLDASGDDAFLTLGEPLRAAAPQSAGADSGSVLWRLPHEVAVDAENGHVYQVGDATAWLLGSVPPLPAPALQSFPGHDDLVARAMWAVTVHRDHVLPFSRALDEELRAELVARP